jgi:hypothetical protein
LDGAWIVIFLIPSLVAVFLSIHRHYQSLAKRLSLANAKPLTEFKRQRVIMPISGVHQGTLEALRYARSLSEDITVVHVGIDEATVKKVQDRWERWGMGIPLVIIDSPYRELMHPLLTYIEDAISQQAPDEVISVVVPEFVPKRWWHNFLHTQTATVLRWALLHEPGVVVVDVPYLVN